MTNINTFGLSEFAKTLSRPKKRELLEKLAHFTPFKGNFEIIKQFNELFKEMMGKKDYKQEIVQILDELTKYTENHKILNEILTLLTASAKDELVDSLIDKLSVIQKLL